MYFPTVLATDQAFCNREKEIQRLAYNLENGTPTLLISPRRYGKTSLAIKTLDMVNLVYTHVDLFRSLTEAEVVQAILHGIADVITKLETAPSKVMKLVTDFFSGIHIKLVLEQVGVGVELSRDAQGLPSETLLKTLEKLNDFLKKRNQKVVLFLDEFQVLSEVLENHAIEAVLRGVAQKSKQIRFVFAGSNRHLMEMMFNDNERPFFNLCDQITLKRITFEKYEPHIQKAAHKKWGCDLDIDLIKEILRQTARHPYYVNKLCASLWFESEPASVESVIETWDQLVLEGATYVEQDLGLLSVNQRRVLIQLAKDRQVAKPTSIEYAKYWNMNQASIHKTLKVLMQRDYVYLDEEGFYRVLDPLVEAVISR